MTRRVRIAPSILSADFARLGEEVRAISKAGADYIHIDVMDGHFVPNLTVGPPVVKSLRPHCELPLDVHLMIDPVDPYIDGFADAGADIVTIHVEASGETAETIERIRRANKRPGLSLKPATPPEAVLPFLDRIELVLVMTVEPGFGGQTFMAPQLDKIRRLRQAIDAAGRAIDLEVDGGITAETAARAIEAGADVLVAGSAVFMGGPESYEANIARLRNPAREAQFHSGPAHRSKIVYAGRKTRAPGE
ncbi:MAG: ribulose-phosphate 3-epimerase [Alphaproteobacteria bacterium]